MAVAHWKKDDRPPAPFRPGRPLWKSRLKRSAAFIAGVGRSPGNSRSLFLAIILLLQWEMGGSQSPARISLVADPEDSLFGSVIIENPDPGILTAVHDIRPRAEAWSHFFRVFYHGRDAGEAPAGLPPMLGDYGVQGQRLYFRPRFPFIEGRRYRVWFDTGELFREEGDIVAAVPPFRLDTIVAIPELTVLPQPEVRAIYPSAETWPANQLKFYLLFSMPMRPGEAYDHLRLLDEDGQVVESPFLPLEPELWDDSGCRLTVWFDPGRIKRDLIPNREQGPPLAENRTYRLIIDGNWRDASGRPLGRDFEKVFFTIAVDRRQPQPAEWSVKTPEPGSRDPLILTFPEPLDYALLTSALAVFTAAGQPVAGAVEVGWEERAWGFRPAEPWPRGPYELRIRSDLEDLAGNNLERPFDRDINPEETAATGRKEPLILSFVITPKE